MKKMKKLLACIAASGALLGLSLNATAQTRPPFPAKPVTLVVPFTPGSGSDTIARLIGPHLAAKWGQPVVVDNKPGASGNLGTQAVVRADPDGHTLLMAINTHTMTPAIYTSQSYDAVRDFAPLAKLAEANFAFAVHPSVPAQDVRSLIALAKGQPGKLNYATPGNGTPHHLAMELFKNRTGTFILHIPYRGAAPAMADVMGGQVPCMFLDLASGLTVMQSGKVRPLAIGSARRSPLLPEVPTLAEAGVPDSEVYAFQGILGPAGLPAEVVARLNAELNKSFETPAVRKRFADIGMEALPGTPAQFLQLARAESKRWGAVIKAAGIKLD